MIHLCLLFAYVPIQLDTPRVPAPSHITVELQGNYLHLPHDVKRLVGRTTIKTVLVDGVQKPVSVTKMVNVVETWRMAVPIDELQIVRNGRPLTRAQLARLLEANTPVVRIPVFERQFLRLVKPGTIVIIGPAPGDRESIRTSEK